MNENKTIELQLRENFGIEDAICRNLNTLANDTYEVVSSGGKYALKLYNPASRTPQDVAWELELVNHLLERGIPTAKPVTGSNGQLQSFIVDGVKRPTVLFEWLPGEKTSGNHENYVLDDGKPNLNDSNAEYGRVARVLVRFRGVFKLRFCATRFIP